MPGTRLRIDSRLRTALSPLYRWVAHRIRLTGFETLLLSPENSSRAILRAGGSRSPGAIE